MRQDFAPWELPSHLRVDNGTPWARGQVPTALAQWVIGLSVDVHWNNPRCPQENGVVERSQGTSNRWGEPWTCDTTAELQWRLDRMDRLHRESYPYQHSGRKAPGATPKYLASVIFFDGGWWHRQSLTHRFSSYFTSRPRRTRCPARR